ncbi:LytTR family DNA-binding domain-containing protein [Lacihabitans lacunae]|jgi:DNA-binding LytR/AlgR family response regulator|uniref:LytTR family DNA-binding domain-containing protein n=1 Tax=Lacihabitans lacunae TaxID=1028214 RepID=A0ABV7Z3H1_9BACT
MKKWINADPHDIVMLKAETNYTVYYFRNGEKYISGFTLKIHEEKEELKSFIRVNRSHLLNPEHIKKLKTKDKVTRILMSNGVETHVSRRRNPFKTAL